MEEEKIAPLVKAMNEHDEINHKPKPQTLYVKIGSDNSKKKNPKVYVIKSEIKNDKKRFFIFFIFFNYEEKIFRLKNIYFII